MNIKQEHIDDILKLPELDQIINATDFYFQKGQDVLKQWLDMNILSDLQKRLLELSEDYEQIQIEAKNDQEIGRVLEILFEIISYCDNKAKDKNALNKYNDKRCLAKASVRMNNWIEHLILFKFTPDKLGVGSTKNAFNYLLDPANNTTILSENHRKLIAENLFKHNFNSVNFVTDLKSYFEVGDIKTHNPLNYTHLLSRIIYAIEDEWKEEVVALMAADRTGWQDEHIEELEYFDASIVWNSKRPSGTNETLKFLNNIIKEGGTFNLYYSAGGYVKYKATILDFAENQKQLDEKAWDNRIERIMHYDNDFSKYTDDNKTARIVFLAKSLEKIKPIPVSSFKFYKGYDVPRQDNLSPVKFEPETFPETNDLNNSNNIENPMDTPLNQIVFGPPGTGKTYNTINKALEIVGVNTKGKTRNELKEIFDTKMKEEQIVFTTFHQSMTYEDFIEGIKPIEPKTEGGAVNYKILDGIFKRISKRAKENNELSSLKTLADERIPFDTAFDILIQKIETALLEDVVLTPNEMKKGLVVQLASSFFSITSINGASIRMMTRTGNEQNTMTRPTLKLIFEDLSNLEKYVRGGMKTYYKALVEEMYKWKSDIVDLSKNIVALNYVLIIDEINRGNLSQIFGELITLIEEDKRLNKDEALQVTLPYSKDQFGVPSNLYIIGTMNTADRSVEALDTALRRRFSFTEMPPRYGLSGLDYEFAGVKGHEILLKINKRIEKLLDRDHLIGHSYFLLNEEEKKRAELKLMDSFYRNIIPLLQEYFFGDYAKIGAVLGEGFIYRENEKDQTDFATGYENEDFSETDIFQIIDYRKEQPGNNFIQNGMTFEKAIRLLMNHPLTD